MIWNTWLLIRSLKLREPAKFNILSKGISKSWFESSYRIVWCFWTCMYIMFSTQEFGRDSALLWEIWNFLFFWDGLNSMDILSLSSNTLSLILLPLTTPCHNRWQAKHRHRRRLPPPGKVSLSPFFLFLPSPTTLPRAGDGSPFSFSPSSTLSPFLLPPSLCVRAQRRRN